MNASRPPADAPIPTMGKREGDDAVPDSRLRRHPLGIAAAENETWIESIFPDGLPLDPEGPVFGEDSYEQIPAARDALFPKGINWLSSLLSKAIE